MSMADTSKMSTAELIRRFVNDISSLVDREITLAKEELREDVSSSISSAILMIAGGVLLLVGLVCLVMAVVLALSLVMPGWAASIIVGVIFLIVGALVALFGKSKLRTKPLRRTRDTLGEDISWARGRLNK